MANKKTKQLIDERIKLKVHNFLEAESGRMTALEWLIRAYSGESVVTYEEKQKDGSYVQKKRPAKDREQFQAAIAALPYQSAKIPALDPSKILDEDETTVEEIRDNLTAILSKLPENKIELPIEAESESETVEFQEVDDNESS